MTLTAPTHLRVYDRRLPLAPELHAERRDWIIAQYRAGNSAKAIGAALGVSRGFAEKTLTAARQTGVLPPFVSPPSKRAQAAEKPKPVAEAPAPVIEPHDPSKRVVICGSARVTLPRLPGEDAEGAVCTHRPETDPRFSLVRVGPQSARRANVSAVIAAIRGELEARA